MVDRAQLRNDKKVFSIVNIAIYAPLKIISLIVAAVISTIVIEWIGISIGFWDIPGSGHAKNTLINDINQLNESFTKSLIGLAPVEVASNLANSTSSYVTSVIDNINFIKNTILKIFEGVKIFDINKNQDFFGKETDTIISPVVNIANVYVSSAIYSIQIVVVRFVVALLSMPAYFLIAIACFLDGVVARDIRRFTAANESAFAFHRFLPWIKRFFFIGWFFYIAWPSTIHPNVVFIPSAFLCGFAAYNTAKWFKKKI